MSTTVGNEKYGAAGEFKLSLREAQALVASAAAPARQPLLGPFVRQHVRLVLQHTRRAWDWSWQRIQSQQVKKRLRICESVPLGEKRLLAIVQVDGKRFMIGAASGSVSMLAELPGVPGFPDMLRNSLGEDGGAL